MWNTGNKLSAQKALVSRLSSFGDLRPYFSYGSNMVLDQMADRCPAARFLGRARLMNYEFRICRSGYATVVPKRGTTVHGVIWLLSRRDERALDIYEQVRRGLYRKTTCLVRLTGGRELRVLIYKAAQPGRGHPHAGYLEPIIRAARALGFPSEAIADLARWLH